MTIDLKYQKPHDIALKRSFSVSAARLYIQKNKLRCEVIKNAPFNRQNQLKKDKFCVQRTKIVYKIFEFF